jgi:pimeloyl-ACP methyl ester carboxylesterase
MRTNLLLIALAVGLGLRGAATAADGPGLGACTGVPDLARARCGTIRVPLDRANPSVGTTQVAFALLPRRDASRPSLGTLVPNPGGPGVSVIGSSEAQYARSLAPLLDRRDLLLVDPRGTGRSDAIACKTLGGSALAFSTGEQAVARIGACGRELGARVGSYGSAAVADAGLRGPTSRTGPLDRAQRGKPDRDRPVGAQCLDWPNDPTAGPPVLAGARFPDVPVLVLSGELDANTPSAAGRLAAAQFPHATFVEIPNAGHTPVNDSTCAGNLALRFVAALQANPRACVRTGKPPAVAPRAPARGTTAERRALGLIAVTAGDLLEQGGVLELAGTAGGLRGGRYVMQRNGTVRLVGVRVVRDASVSGVLGLAHAGLAGTLRLAGPGVPAGQLQVQLAENGRSRARGTLGGCRVDFSFRL